MEETVLLRAEGVKQHFRVKREWGRKATLYAVDGVTLSIEAGETFGIVGESGCGKSTLGRIFLHLYPLTEGKLYFQGRDVSSFKGKELKNFRCDAQMIFQDPASCLNPRRKIIDILLEPYAIHEMYSDQERRDKINGLCDMVGLSQTYLGRYPHEMSGGQKQRVGIARALALEPKFIVCDEPVSALDVSIQAQVLNLLDDIQKRLGLAYLFISHNLSVVEHCCKRIGVMYLGKVVELASADILYKNAMHPYTRALIAAIPVVDDGTGDARQSQPLLAGDIPSPTSPPAGCAFHTRCPHAEVRCAEERPPLIEAEPGHFVACFLHGALSPVLELNT
ncbi:MAG: ATP-binding cassette domain-containing protein [Peptococcaceae bacterium]|nr:ATP-binding cassette domain-containing protein [Peptococcaceae bacterium]